MHNHKSALAKGGWTLFLETSIFCSPLPKDIIYFDSEKNVDSDWKIKG